MQAMLKPFFKWLSPAGAQARLSVLIFHRVLPAPDALLPDEVDARRFDEICGWLKRWLNVLALDEAVQRLQAGTLPACATCITFDDGYADNHDVALPVLQRHGLPATFFIATGFLDGGRMWNDTVIELVRRTRLPMLSLEGLLGAEFSCVPVRSLEDKRAAIESLISQLKYQPVSLRLGLAEQLALQAEVHLPTDLMMTSDQVRALRRAGMQIGAHTVSHPILATLDRATAHSEIAISKRVLENLLGERVGLLAYPNGKPAVDYNAESVALARALGFDAAVSTQWGASRADTDVFQLPRFTPWDRTALRFGMRLASNLWRA